MNLQSIIDHLANDADSFLAGTTSREQARAGIAEFLTIEYSGLVAADRKTITDAVIAMLEQDDFFGTEFVGNPFADDPDEDA